MDENHTAYKTRKLNFICSKNNYIVEPRDFTFMHNFTYVFQFKKKSLIFPCKLEEQ